MAQISSFRQTQPPAWAVLERQLLDAMNQAAPLFIDKYTRPGGSLIWREEYPGDGVWVDDLYEAFFNWPLFYALGGSEYIGTKAVQQWNAITQQVTYDYGRITNEFINDDDWFHNSENYVYFYALGLSDPTNAAMLRRAQRFAGFYMNEDPDVPNYDPQLRLIRSPFSGSKGPLFHARYADVEYNLVHGHTTLGPGFDLPHKWFNDPRERERIHARFDAIVMQGDIPVNLGVVPLIAHAYLLTGEVKYRTWITNYVDVWLERIHQNNGIIPDNIGLNGGIGENRQGQWWGGFYGWAATFSQQMIGSALTIAAESAHLVTGDASYLELLRSQLDMLIAQGHEIDGSLQVPARHKDEGWTDFGTMRPDPAINLWHASMTNSDWDRLEHLRRGNEKAWQQVTVRGPRAADDRAWTRYLAGDCPNYPEAILQANYQEVCRRTAMILEDTTDMTTHTNEHHWLERNPIHTEALAQLTMGGPQTVYWGGLCRGRVRHFDALQQRPGLPPDTAALVSRLEAQSMDLTLVNLSVHEARQVTVQAGSFGEHSFLQATVLDAAIEPIKINAKTFVVNLKPASQIDLRLSMQLHCNHPTYAYPWHQDTIPFR